MKKQGTPGGEQEENKDPSILDRLKSFYDYNFKGGGGGDFFGKGVSKEIKKTRGIEEEEE